MNARDFILGVGATLLFLMIGALLYLQVNSAKPDLVTVVQTAMEPLEAEIARLNDDVSQLSGSTEHNEEFAAAVERVVQPLSDRITAVSEQLGQRDFVTREELDARTQAVAQLAQTNRDDLAAIVSGETDLLGNMNLRAQESVRSVTAKNGYLRVINNGPAERLRVGSVLYRVPPGISGIVVPAGTVISSVSGATIGKMPDEGGMSLEFYRGRFHRL